MAPAPPAPPLGAAPPISSEAARAGRGERRRPPSAHAYAGRHPPATGLAHRHGGGRGRRRRRGAAGHDGAAGRAGAAAGHGPEAGGVLVSAAGRPSPPSLSLPGGGACGSGLGRAAPPLRGPRRPVPCVAGTWWTAAGSSSGRSTWASTVGTCSARAIPASSLGLSTIRVCSSVSAARRCRAAGSGALGGGGLVSGRSPGSGT